ncbi:Cyclin-B1-2 [Striga hermonthica]|uniref:Cyclin-B1-2 n=1 Tax=Striga hermonthica TaxID=68872 RepID=A0A9N7RNJ8_STRHE|nr:Cyclin-B1-2 [Striga hermonthica]
MASRHVVQQHNGGEIVAGDNKQKIMVEERKNRRALGDIGNVVAVRGVEGKPLSQVTRPVTRGFCAQLVANAENVPAENKKRAVDHKPTRKKAATIKPKPEEIIEISPDTVERVAAETNKEENPAKKPSKKNAPTLTSTLSARSKAACGLSYNNKPKEQTVVDIDADDVNNDLAAVEYVEDMYKFYKSAENEGRAHDYMNSQPEINEKMRAILIDWLVQVHSKFELSPETFYLTVNILDRYLSGRPTSRRELQLVGLGSMLIASKYEEIWAPEVNELVSISDNTYTDKQILVMEKQILGQLEWSLTVPTPYVFLVRFVKASLTDLKVENMVYFLAELGMMNYETLVYSPSMIAASAVYAARRTLNKAPFWSETLKLHTGFSEQQIMDCAILLVSFHESRGDRKKLRAIYKKYKIAF